MIGLKCRGVFALACALFVAGFAQSASADTVQVAPGIQVTKRTYAAPAKEQPFFGFEAKTDAQRDEDDKFVKALVQAAGTKEKALDEVVKRGWRALGSGKYPEAALRFNQAYLVAPEQSVVYHGLAAIAQIRFKDLDYAEELFRIAQKQPNPLKMLNADYGRVLLVAKRPKEAQPVLEQAVKDTPDFGDAWINLAHARLQNGDRDAACAAADVAMKQRPSSNAKVDLAKLRNDAQCK
ncbi:tetratricopeptide repeat protein [Bradyrhizobium sp. AUGA SZCCT0169]|uniref:tetratricopeptide repeat protein n=1 Tax=Bradyrhizobium sp. AUGA SZCCT0169 TaxID=2807663 RepID=UPI001BA963B5|nr:tetratricopeptide repeat protein [Bradyrhizobium sp. AUGA SZCCT0169]MBR1246239.1 tetratricopeptide repeat protein [Bradyrhizobium sp. AUGA SZCCT0169]